MKRQVTAALLLIGLSGTAGATLPGAQPDSLPGTAGGAGAVATNANFTWHRVFTGYPMDYYAFGKETFTEDNVPLLMGVAAATTALWIIDHQVYNSAKRYYFDSHPFKSFTDEAVMIGDGQSHLVLAGGLALYGLASGSSKELKVASNITESMVASGLLVQLLKRLIGRESPEEESYRTGKWRPFSSWLKYSRDQPKYYSFPSGHITTITSTMTVLWNNYPDADWLKPVGYALIGTTGVCLIVEDMHWLSDFPLAVLLGYTIGNIVSRPAPGPDTGSTSVLDDVSIHPMLIDGFGVSVSLRIR